MHRSLVALLVTASLSLGSSGCITRILTDGQISATRRVGNQFDTIDDFKVGRTGTEAGIGQFEGLHAVAPYSTDMLYLLTKTWGAYGAVFLLDDIEAAQDAGDDDAEMRARVQARHAYDRSIYYGLQAMTQQVDGFDDAKKDAPKLATWLAKNFKDKDDASLLLWTGLSWLERVDAMKGDDVEGPPLVAELYIGAALVERAVALDPAADHFLGLITLGGYHARSSMAEPEQAKKYLDEALADTHGRSLTVQMTYAATYACSKGDGALYQDMLKRVLDTRVDDQNLRLSNAIAKHRAMRWLSKKRAKDACGIDLAIAAK